MAAPPPYNLSFVPGGAPGGPPPAGAVPPGMPPPYPAMAPPGAFGYPPAGPPQPPPPVPAGQAPPFVAPPAIVMGPIYNPPIPLTTTVPRPMQDGTTIHITGSIPANPKRFHINLSMGGGLNQKVATALHINPRWDDRSPVVVRNSYLKSRWGSEERWGEFFPLTAGQNFECIILVQSDCYKVAFNGHHFCEFKHRHPKDQVSHLVIEGTVTLSCVWFQAAPQTGPAPGVMPAPTFPQMHPPLAAGAVPASTTFTMPYKQQIPGALYAGRMIYISGTPKSPSYDRFHINFGYDEKFKKDIAFHFNPRYKDKQVVRNTMAGYNWGKEERAQPEFPFHPGKPFDIIVLVEKDQYKVAVNGQHFITYQHRLRNLSHIKYLEIKGDITLSSVRL